MGKSATSRFVNALALLTRNLSPVNPAAVDACPAQSNRTERQTVYDLYEPNRSALKTVIVIHGLTLQGEKDHRLIRFSRALAGSGIRVAAIGLPGLKECRFAPADIHSIDDLVGFLFRRYQQEIGIIGFSLGAGLALVAAAESDIGNRIGPLILFGPYYDFRDVRRRIMEIKTMVPNTDEEWNNFIWIHLLLAYRVQESLPLESVQRTEIETFLTHYCHEPSLSRKQEFYRSHLADLRLSDSRLYPEDEIVSASISPAHKIRSIHGRVFLLHDQNDQLVPPVHSRRIYRELTARGLPDAQRLLITPLLSHVTARSSYKMIDIFPLLGILGEIFR